MDDLSPSVGIAFIICVTIISVAIIVCDCERQKSTTTESTTEAADTSTEDMTPAQQLLFMRLIKALP